MKNQEIDTKISQAFEAIVPDVEEKILDRCFEQKENIIPFPADKKNTRNRFREIAGLVVGVAAAFAVVIGGAFGAHLYKANYAVSSIVSLDVNPSVEIKVNQKGSVLEVIPRNEDAEIIIGDMDFEGSSLEITLNALVGSMLKNGYLNEIANSILVSIDGADDEKSLELQAQIAEEIENTLLAQEFNAAVLCQTVKPTDELKELAETHDVSVGKAQLIQEIANQNEQYTFEDLVSLSINELSLLTKSNDMELENISSTGTVSTKAYIEEKQAIAAALTAAGLDASVQTFLEEFECELEFDNGKMVYEIEFVYSESEYEYDIDALTGELLNSEVKPVKKPEPSTTPEPTAEPTVTPEPTEEPGKDPKPTKEPRPDEELTLLTEEQVKELILTHLTLAADLIDDFEIRLVNNKNNHFYQIKFEVGDTDYTFKIDAVTGEILASDSETDDDETEKDDKNEDKEKPDKDRPQIPGWPTSEEFPSLEEIKNLVLAHANVAEDVVDDFEVRFVNNKNNIFFLIKFEVNDTDYTYKVNALTGEIIASDSEPDSDEESENAEDKEDNDKEQPEHPWGDWEDWFDEDTWEDWFEGESPESWGNWEEFQDWKGWEKPGGWGNVENWPQFPQLQPEENPEENTDESTEGTTETPSEDETDKEEESKNPWDHLGDWFDWMKPGNNNNKGNN